MRTATTRPTFEFMEPRQLMSAAAVLKSGTLTITGSDTADAIAVTTSRVTTDAASTVRAGTTSVTLNTDLLKSAAGLELSGANTTGRPAAGGYLVGFPILTTSDFKYAASPFAPVSGIIRHSGTITFNGNVTVGDFAIGFDAARATDGRSGFYVASTVGIKAILFDLAPPSAVSATARKLSIGRTDLKVSPEFGAFLQGNGLSRSNLTGAVVGAARSDGVATTSTAGVISVSVGPRDGDARTFYFHSNKVKSVEVYAGSGSDKVNVDGVVLSGKLLVSTAGGADSVGISGVFANALRLDTGSHNDTAAVRKSGFALATAHLGGGDDVFTSTQTTYSGTRHFSGSFGSDKATADGDLTADDFDRIEALVLT